MKNILSTSLISIFSFAFVMTTSMATVNAQPSTPNEILSAIDGTYDHTLDDAKVSESMSSPTFSLTSFHANKMMDAKDTTLSSVLSAIDGEYDQ